MSSAMTQLAGHYIARKYTQIGTALQAGKLVRGTAVPPTVIGGPVGSTYPDPISGGMILRKVSLLENHASLGTITERGYLPGMWSPMHATLPGNPYDTFSGTADLAGKTFILLPINAAAVLGRCAVETSGSWNL
jgi:hypothetical protein